MASKLAIKPVTKQRKKWQTLLQNSAEETATGSLRVLIDTNVWFSGIIYGGTPEEVIRLCRHNYIIVSSDYIISELFANLKLIKAPYKWRNELERLLKAFCLLVEPSDPPTVSRDSGDDPVIAAAMTGGCDFIITGDKDLLALKSYRKMLIITPSEFLNTRV